MLNQTVSVVLPVGADEAFRFLADLTNVPSWATEFITGSFEIRGDHALVQTANGPLQMRIRSDAATRVVDYLGEIEPGAVAVFPTRVLPVPPTEDTSLFLFTLIQGPGQPDEAFHDGVASLERELEGLVRLLAGARR